MLRRLYLSARIPGIRLSTTSSTTTQSEDYFTKNKRLNRPLSPYMLYTVYKLQITSVLSMTHRITGLGLSVLLYGGGIAALASSQTNFAQVLQSIEGSVSPSILVAFKVLAGIQMLTISLNKCRNNWCTLRFGCRLPHTQWFASLVLGFRLRIQNQRIIYFWLYSRR